LKGGGPVLAALLVAGALFDSAPAASGSRYAKQELRIPMRDGVKLFTAVYTPLRPASNLPILLTRTPYSVSPYGPALRKHVGPSLALESEGFIFVYQDVRGRYMSEGAWREMTPQKTAHGGPNDIDESTDTWDTIDWLVKNVPGNNGRVGLVGISYPGFYAAAGLIDAHPALRAVSPQAPVADLYAGDDSYHNGAFYLAANFDFYASFFPRPDGPFVPTHRERFDYGTKDGYDYLLRLGSLANAEARFGRPNPLWRDNIDHPNREEHWNAMDLRPHLRGIRPAVLTVGGWYDAEDLAGPLHVYRAVEGSSPGADNRLVMGPWEHGGWEDKDGDGLGPLRFGSRTAAFFQEQIERPFFAHHLKDAVEPAAAEATVFETGSNVWRRFSAWPPAQGTPRTLYLRAGRKLSFDPPEESGDSAFDEYVSDPARPVPFLDRPVTGMPGDYMTEDQAFAAARPDVLVYETAPLTEALTVAGPVGVKLTVSSTGTDGDFVVKLIDAAEGPRGFQQLVRGEPFRARFRNGFEAPEPLVPGQPAGIAFDMPDVFHTFRPGHRLMVHVQSSWFPLVDRNPQTFVDIAHAKPEDFRVATERIYRGRGQGLRLTVLSN
jgi:uncharacterized protein